MVRKASPLVVAAMRMAGASSFGAGRESSHGVQMRLVACRVVRQREGAPAGTSSV
jgi:hypothetical protein